MWRVTQRTQLSSCVGVAEQRCHLAYWMFDVEKSLLVNFVKYPLYLSILLRKIFSFSCFDEANTSAHFSFYVLIILFNERQHRLNFDFFYL